MAFAKRKPPLVIGAEASGEVAAVGEGVTRFKPGQPVVMYGALTCGVCGACTEGRDNLCENVAGLLGFHVDGFARELMNLPERLVIPVPGGVLIRAADRAIIGAVGISGDSSDNDEAAAVAGIAAAGLSADPG